VSIQDLMASKDKIELEDGGDLVTYCVSFHPSTLVSGYCAYPLPDCLLYITNRQLTDASLPSLPHPFLSQPNSHNIRAYSVTANSSPPASPGSITSHHNHNHNHNHVHNHIHNHHYQPHTTYQALVEGATSQTNYHNTYTRGMEGLSMPMIASPTREKEGPPMFCGIELKWISYVVL
jgi:hypothetical protein